MMILDHNPYFSYARYLGKSSQKNIAGLISNLDNDAPAKIKSNSPPRIVRFGEELYIFGDRADVLFGTCYLRDNPDAELMVEEFESPEQAKARYISVFGHPYETHEFEHQDEVPAEESKETEPGMAFFNEARATSEVVIMLKHYIRAFTIGSRKPDKAPYLLGHSGIAKSSVVYKAVESLDAQSKQKTIQELKDSSDPMDWGFKLIEIRAGFLDKTDLMGYATDVEVEGKAAWADSPKKELLLCTTEFVNECRKWIKNLSEDDITPENMPLIEKMRYYAKTPVLFLDEVNRAPNMILAQIMIIINANRLQKYNLDISPKICAANELVDMEDMDQTSAELFDYAVNKEIDLAAAGRWTKYLVSGKDPSVIQSTYSYLKEKYESSTAAVKALDWALKNKKLYDHGSIDDYGKFPTFRGWEDVCKYLAWTEKSGERPLTDIIKSLLGSKVNPTEFVEGPWNDSKSTDMFIHHCMESGLPCALLGIAGVAKTAKIVQYAKSKNAVVEFIDLSAEDRTTVNGFPEKRAFLRDIFQDHLPENHRYQGYDHDKDQDVVNSQLFKAFESEVSKNPMVPRETTTTKPHESILNNILKLKERAKKGEKVKLILFFDELNRANPIVQSSIFEAVSLKKYRGISLEGIDFSIVTAANWQKKSAMEQEKHYNVYPLDTATLHRFATKFIEEVNDEDVKSFMNILEDRHKLAYNMLKKVWTTEPTKIRDMFNNFRSTGGEEITINTNIFTFREVTQIESQMLQYDYDLTFGFTIEDLRKVIGVLNSPHYILYAHDPDSMMDWEHAYELRSLYVKPRQREITVSEFAKRSIPLLSDNGVDKDTKIKILTLLRFVEDDMFAELKKTFLFNLPKDPKFREFIMGLIMTGYSERTLSRMTAASITEDNIFGEKEEATRAVNRVIADLPADALDTGLITHIIYLLKESHEKIPLSKIVQVVEIYNDSTEAKQSTLTIPLHKVLDQLNDYSDKITHDYEYKVETTIKDILDGENLDADLLSVLNKYILHPPMVEESGREISGYEIILGHHYIDDEHVVPDLFTLSIKKSNSNDEASRSVTFDDHVFQVEKVKDTGDGHVNIKYKGKIGHINISVEVDAKNPEIADGVNLLSKDVLDDPSLLVHKNLSSLAGSLKAILVHDADISDIPDLDKNDISKLKNVKQVASKKPDYVRTMDKTANMALIFKRSFGGFEKLFS